MKKILFLLSLFLIFTKNIFCQEELCLIYKDTNTNIKNRISIYARVEANDEIYYYFLRNGEIDPSNYYYTAVDPNYKINLLKADFQQLRNAFIKFTEWETTALQNNVAKFSKEIQISVKSEYMIWSSYDIMRKWNILYIKDKRDTLEFKFIFYWQPSYTIEKASLTILSNTVYSDDINKRFSMNVNLNSDDIKRFLDNTTEEKIKTAIKIYREKEKENERQKKLQDNLFR